MDLTFYSDLLDEAAENSSSQILAMSPFLQWEKERFLAKANDKGFGPKTFCTVPPVFDFSRESQKGI